MKRDIVFVAFLAGLTLICAVKVIVGRTGNGKSYLITLTGCPRTSCDGSESCTKETYICDNGVVDTIGLDDDGKEYKVKYEGKEVTLSGLTYPVYSLFDTLEGKHITDVEFYLVYDANNIRFGSSSQFFYNFTTTDLKCPVNTVLNKYRDVHSKIASGYDIRVSEGATSIDLKGKGCVLSLAKDWREKVIMSDLAGIRSRVDRVNCNKLKERKKEFDEVQKAQPKDLVLSKCDYEKVIRYEKTGNDWSVNFMNIVSFGGGGGTRAITERAVDEECARKDEVKNEGIKVENKALNDKQIALLATIATIDKGLAECKAYLSDWTE